MLSSSDQGFKPALHGTETILLTEMDNGVRAYIQFALTRFGYTVLQGTRGQEAIQLCKGHQKPVRLLISDIWMAKMRGRKVAEALVAARPEIKALFLSGTEDDVIAQERVAFLQKPFSPEALARKVRDVLDGAKKGNHQEESRFDQFLNSARAMSSD